MENDTSSWVNLPNCLTIVRMFLIPVFLIAYYQLPEQRYVSMAIFALASFTDCLDGYLARKMNRITSFGKLCDPLADKLMVLSILFCLAGDGALAPERHPALNWVYLFSMLGKEFYMLAGSMVMLKKGVVVQSNIWGKAATLFFVIGIITVFPWHENALFLRIGQFVIPVAVILSYMAMVSYTVESVKKLNALKTS